MSALLIAPQHDAATTETRQWANRLLARLPHDIEGVEPCSRPVVDGRLAAGAHLVYIGHGEADCLLIPGVGFRKRTVLVDAKNVGLNRTVIAVACDSARTLGRRANVAAYLGWDRKIAFPSYNASPFSDAVVESVSHFLKGGTFLQLQDTFIGKLAAAEHAYLEDMKATNENGASWGILCAQYWAATMIAIGNPLQTA